MHKIFPNFDSVLLKRKLYVVYCMYNWTILGTIWVVLLGFKRTFITEHGIRDNIKISKSQRSCFELDLEWIFGWSVSTVRYKITTLLIYVYTVDSRYLEFQGTLWNASRYPYLDISDLQNWGKLIRTATFNKYIICWTLEVRDILKILWKRGAISPLFHNIFLPVVRFSCSGRDQIFTSR